MAPQKLVGGLCCVFALASAQGGYAQARHKLLRSRLRGELRAALRGGDRDEPATAQLWPQASAAARANPAASEATFRSLPALQAQAQAGPAAAFAAGGAPSVTEAPGGGGVAGRSYFGSVLLAPAAFEHLVFVVDFTDEEVVDVWGYDERDTGVFGKCDGEPYGLEGGALGMEGMFDPDSCIVETFAGVGLELQDVTLRHDTDEVVLTFADTMMGTEMAATLSHGHPPRAPTVKPRGSVH